MRKEKYYIKVYVDSSYQSEDNNAYCCYVFEGFINEKVNHEEIFSLGTTPDSAFSEYLGVEKTLIKLESFLKKRNISKKRIHLTIYTDLQNIPRQYKNWILPPLDLRISRCFSRIRQLLLKYYKADIFWIPRNQNIAGKLLERFIHR